MKKFLILAVVMLTALCAQAQFFTGIEVGGAVQYTNQHGKSNAGADIRATKRINEWSRVRVLADINGFVPNGFDRYGTVKVGATVDVQPLYLFADYGLSVNPSAKQSVGMAFDMGLGLQVALASRWHLFTELSIDRINSGKLWQSTPAVKAGVMYSVAP